MFSPKKNYQEFNMVFNCADNLIRLLLFLLMFWLQTWVLSDLPHPYLPHKVLLFQCVILQNFGLSEKSFIVKSSKQESKMNDKQNQKPPAGLVQDLCSTTPPEVIVSFFIIFLASINHCYVADPQTYILQPRPLSREGDDI